MGLAAMTESEFLKRAIHEEVARRPYDTQWSARFVAEHERLLSLFPTELMGVKHFGRTAIPSMLAKPIIHLLGGVASMAVADAVMMPLLKSDYTT